MKKKLQAMCKRVGYKTFYKGFRNALILGGVSLVLAVLVLVISIAGRKEPKETVYVYEVEMSYVTYQTSPDNERLKVPVETTKTVYLIGGEKEWK